MNEKIKQLVEKAPYTTISTEGRLFSQQDLAKFAELIIKECGTVAGRDWDTAETAIYKHFGVEE